MPSYSALLENLDQAERHLLIQRRLLDELSESLLFEMGKVSMRMEVSDLRQLMREVVQVQQQIFPHRSLHIEEEPDFPLSLQVDPFHIRQVMTNYLSNALKYSPVEQSITVGLQVENGHIRFWVRI